MSGEEDGEERRDREKSGESDMEKGRMLGEKRKKKDEIKIMRSCVATRRLGWWRTEQADRKLGK